MELTRYPLEQLIKYDVPLPAAVPGDELSEHYDAQVKSRRVIKCAIIFIISPVAVRNVCHGTGVNTFMYIFMTAITHMIVKWYLDEQICYLIGRN